MTRAGLLSELAIASSDTPGDDPRYGLLHSLGLEAVDDGSTSGARHGELHELTLQAIYIQAAPLSDQTVKSLTTVTMTAILDDSTNADSWAWEVVSGDAVDLTTSGPNGNTVTFTSPAVADGGSTVIGVEGTKAGVTSAQVTCTITSRPHGRWLLNDADEWVPIRSSYL